MLRSSDMIRQLDTRQLDLREVRLFRSLPIRWSTVCILAVAITNVSSDFSLILRISMSHQASIDLILL